MRKLFHSFVIINADVDIKHIKDICGVFIKIILITNTSLAQQIHTRKEVANELPLLPPKRQVP